MRHQRKAQLLMLLAMALMVGVAVRPSAAQAHAALESSVPAANQLLRSAPGEVLLNFNEPLDTGTTELALVDAAGRVITVGPYSYSNDNRTVAVSLPALSPGSYTVFWANVSKVDGHRITGSFPFTILNQDGSLPGGAFIGGSSGGSEPSAEPAPALVRFLALLGLTGAGAGAMLLLLASSSASRAARIVIGAAAAVLLAATLLELLGLRQTYSGTSTWDFILSTRTGGFWLARLGVSLLAAVMVTYILDAPRRTATVLGLAILLYLAMFTATSHAAASPGGNWAQAIDIVHSGAAIGWVASVLGLAFAARLTLGDIVWGQWVRRFSLVATGLVAVLLASGVLSALIQFDTPEKLTSTQYGVVLLVKIGLIVPLLGIAGFNALANRSRWVDMATHRRRLIMTGSLEVVAGVVVFGAAALLTQSVVPRSVIDASKGFDDVQAVGAVDLRLVVSPNFAGFNSFVLQVTDASGTPVDDADVRLRFTREGAEAGTATLDLEPVSGGTYIGDGSYLGIVGNWQVTAEVLQANAPDARTRFDVRPSTPPDLTLSGSWANPAAGMPGRQFASIALAFAGAAGIAVTLAARGLVSKRLRLGASACAALVVLGGTGSAMSVQGPSDVPGGTAPVATTSEDESTPRPGDRTLTLSDISAFEREDGVTVVLMTFRNMGRADRLVSISADDASKATVVGARVCGEPPFSGQPGVPIELPSGSTVTLREGGCRLEIVGAPAGYIRLTLEFETAETISMDILPSARR